jgi:hypothetical protein
MPEPFLAFVPYLALVVTLWVGANMMIHGYSKLKNLKQAAEETKKTLGIPVGAIFAATILEFFWRILPDNRPNCSDSWTVFCYFHDRKCDYEENKDECSVHCSWQGLLRN